MANHTPFAFHCMVCFEEFQPDERYPVVLPCGHTYVCNICANRLDKCMECRTPLYTLVSLPNGNNTQKTAWSNRTVRHHYEQPSPPPQPPLKKRVALPKNVVLLSLIEATELASEDARKKFEDETAEGEPSANDYPGTPSIPVLQSMASMLDAADDEEERIKVSTSIAVGVAGTYAVAAKGGLEIFPTRPVGGDVITTAVDARDEDVDSLVKFYNIEALEDGGGTPNSRRSKDYLRLCFGDRVQIVTFDGGWAKLARGYGYVKADSNQLVKVGGSVDRACRLEAMLCSLSNRRKELRMEQSKIDNQFIRYMNDLQQSLQNDEDLTVILADAFSPLPEIPEFASVVNDSGEKDRDCEEEEEWTQPSFVLKAAIRPGTPPLEHNRATRFACFSGGMFQRCDSGYAELEGAASNGSINENRPVNNENRAVNNENRPVNNENDVNNAVHLFPNASHPSPSAMRAGAQAWRERHGHEEANVDFRTGLSGHMSLLSSQTNSHKYLDSHRRSGMSSHSGLGMTMASLSGILNSFTLTAVTSTPPRPAADIRRNGSM